MPRFYHNNHVTQSLTILLPYHAFIARTVVIVLLSIAGLDRLLTVGQSCGFCGSALTARLTTMRRDVRRIRGSCRACGNTKYYPVVSTPIHANADCAIDPFFGLPLWLQTPILRHVLWAYNADHLNYLALYFGSALRESKTSYHTVAARLPEVFKTAKHRKAVMKAIGRLAEISKAAGPTSYTPAIQN